MSEHVRGITRPRSLPRMAEKVLYPYPEPTTALGRIMTALMCSALELVLGFDFCATKEVLQQ